MISATSSLILASESPRRKELLARAGFSFEVIPVKVSETLEKNLTVEMQIQRISEQKLTAALAQIKPLKSQDFFVICADTMVVHKGQALGKPANSTEAQLMLESLSGSSHQVITAVSVAFSGQDCLKVKHDLEITCVRFRKLQKNEISTYVQSGAPMDKAGAYGIQGEARKFILHVDGSYTNVVGLPLELTARLLQEIGYTK
jgi:septum formation protein